MIRFYSPLLPDCLELPEIESGHAVRVLRKRVGELIEVVDGRGKLYKCRLISDHPKHAAVEILETIDLPKVWLPTITLAVAPTKNIDRMEWLVEKLVELGIDRIVPLKCERSERRDLKRERLEKIAVSAMKQSLKAILPEISEMTSYKSFINESASQSGQKFVAWCDNDSPRQLLAKTYQQGSDAIILIGPEGDFSPDEVSLAVNAGFKPITLGDNRLRTETAALNAVDTIHIINQAFS